MRLTIAAIGVVCAVSATRCTDTGTRTSSLPIDGTVPEGGSKKQLDVDGETASILRDSFGIPHIFAPSNRAVYVAYGFADAEDRLWQLEMNRRAGRGTLAELLGSSYVAADQYSRLVGYTDSELDVQFSGLSDEEQLLFKSYLEGINRYIQEVIVPDSEHMLPLEFQVYGGIPRPFTTRDLLSSWVIVLRQLLEIGGTELNNQGILRDLIAQHGSEAAYGIFNDLRWLNDPDSPATIPSEHRGARQLAKQPSFGNLGVQLAGADATDFETLQAQALAIWESLSVPIHLGSYGWAVSPERSESGVAMLYGGPMAGFSAPEIIHEVDLNSDEDLHVIGMAFAGMPAVAIGHNRELAWTLTSGRVGDNLDIYVESLCEGGASYRYLSECLPFERRIETIQVQGSDPIELEVLRTVHGPVISRQGDSAFSQKRAHWMNEIQTISALIGFDRATDLASFQAQVNRGTMSFNAIYADRRGNIAYFLAGLNPVRAPGYDLRLPFPGDGSAEWTGALRPIPYVINPEQGWLANWNNKPTDDYDSGDFDTFGKMHSANEIFAQLSGASGISPALMEDIPKYIGRWKVLAPGTKGHTGREARFLKAYLLGALDTVPPSHPVAQAARAVVESWDGSEFLDAVESTTDLSGVVIFSAWLNRVIQNTFSDVLGSHLREADSNVLLHALDFHFTGYSGVPPSRDYFSGTDPNAAMSRAFDEAVAALAEAQGDDPTVWTAPRGDIVFSHLLAGEVGRIPHSIRATYAQIVMLNPVISGENIFSLGQSGRISLVDGQMQLDPHFRDLLPLFRNFQYKKMGIER
jgi:penicillin amidase